MIAPTKSPSTAGARWLFYEREYLRRAGSTPAARTRFRALVRTLQEEAEGELKLVLARLKRERMETPSRADEKLLVADIMTIEAELGYRRSQERTSKPRAIERVYQDEIISAALGPLFAAIGEDAARRLLIGAAQRIAPNHFKAGTDIEALVDGILSWGPR